MKLIYGQISKPHFVKIGRIASAEFIPALIDINKLISRHSAIVGTTGCGKSTTVTSILNELSDSIKYPSSRILIFDIHGEYTNTFKDIANIYKINGDSKDSVKPLNIPYWAMSFDELVSITLGI